jgi:hypothetical protein
MTCVRFQTSIANPADRIVVEKSCSDDDFRCRLANVRIIFNSRREYLESVMKDCHELTLLAEKRSSDC